MARFEKARTPKAQRDWIVAVCTVAALLVSNMGRFRVTNAGLDKSWTSGGHEKSRGSQVQCITALGNLGSLQAERGGFEPPVPVSQHTAFPVPHNRPLCHLSGKRPGSCVWCPGVKIHSTARSRGGWARSCKFLTPDSGPPTPDAFLILSSFSPWLRLFPASCLRLFLSWGLFPWPPWALWRLSWVPSR
jgi:hypothetical protein